MILTCPNCGTQYVVKDGAIPPEGRQVRCASCKHSWHQDPEEGSASEAADEAPVMAQPVEPEAADERPEAQVEEPSNDEDESLTEATMIDPRSGPEAEQRAYEESVIESEESPTIDSASDGSREVADAGLAAAVPSESVESARAEWNEPPQAEAQDDEFSPFATSEFGQEPARRSPLIMILLLVIVVAAVAAAFWFFAPPEWKVRLGLAAAGASPLALVTTHMDRQRLESGQETLNVSGKVINPTGKSQDVPALQAQLRSRTGKLVYNWTIAPPAKSLPPGGGASFNSTEFVPAGGDELTITVGSPKG